MQEVSIEPVDQHDLTDHEEATSSHRHSLSFQTSILYLGRPSP